MEPSEMIEMLRSRAKPLETASTTTEQVEIVKSFIKEREKVYLHRKTRPAWIPVSHRITMTDKRDSEPSNYYGKIRNFWGNDRLIIQPTGVSDWKPALSYYRTIVDKIPIPQPFKRGIYSLYLSELGIYFIKELQDRIKKQHTSVIPLVYRRIHKEASRNPKKKILIKTGHYVESMNLSFGFRKLTLTVKHQKHEESDLTYLQLSRILEFGTSLAPAYSHWTRLKNVFDGGESKAFMKSFLHLYLDVPRKHL